MNLGIIDTDVKLDQDWNDDVLNRKQLANFLTKSLTAESALLAKSRNLGLTVALDADWGSGKTFFVKRWAEDLRAMGHPVVIFDAWENDIGDAAAVALMSSIDEELKKWIQKLPNNKSLRLKVKKSSGNVVKSLRRALIPTSKVVASGLLKKITGVAVEEVFDALMEDDSSKTSPKISEATSFAIEAGLDEIFKKSLEDHQNRSVAIKDFKASMQTVLDVLEKDASASLPMFVFADEVDRCRPSYAVKLLEEIKHIFGAPKICFIVSTNLDQLRQSVCALYGTGFDGRRYLKRFFDRHYTLPEPNYENFAEYLLSEECPLTLRVTIQGLPPALESKGLKRTLAIVNSVFALDLRSQKQIFIVANAASAAIPTDKPVFTLLLLFLCAMQHKFPHHFEYLTSRRLDRKQFSDICQEAFSIDTKFEYKVRTHEYESTFNIKHTNVSEILWIYYDCSFQDLKSTKNKSISINIFDYPSNVILAIAEELPNTYPSDRIYESSISNYGKLIKYAGLLES